MFGNNLPPGCTPGDIDRRMSEPTTCELCGEELDDTEHRSISGEIICEECYDAEKLKQKQIEEEDNTEE